MKRILFIVVLLMATIISVSQVYVLMVIMNDGKTLELPADDVIKNQVATYIDTPVLSCTRTDLNSFVVSWQAIENAKGYNITQNYGL